MHIDYISTDLVASLLGIRRKSSVKELAVKYFGENNLIEIRLKAVKLKQGGFANSRKITFLTFRQAQIIISKSRRNTYSASQKLGFKNFHTGTLRNEQFFILLVKALFEPVLNFEIHREYYCAGDNIDVCIKSDYCFLFIEYDEKGHIYRSKQDKKREEEIRKHCEGDDVYFLRVKDTPDGIVDAIKAISCLLHGDYLGPVTYKDPNDMEKNIPFAILE